MKKIKIFSLFSILLIVLIYTTNITSIPNKIILMDGENPNINTAFGVSIKKLEDEYIAKPAVATIESKTNKVKKIDYEVSLLNTLKIKKIQANVIPKSTVIPVGKTIGLKLYTDGVLVVGMSEIETTNRQKVRPYETTKIKEGDRIIAIDEKTITCTADLVESVNEANGNTVSVKYVRGNEVLSDNINPVKTSSNEYKLGLWVRDAAARGWHLELL